MDPDQFLWHRYAHHRRRRVGLFWFRVALGLAALAGLAMLLLVKP